MYEYKRIHINGLKALGLFLVIKIVKVVVHWYSKNTSHHRKCSLRTHIRAFAIACLDWIERGRRWGSGSFLGLELLGLVLLAERLIAGAAAVAVASALRVKFRVRRIGVLDVTEERVHRRRLVLLFVQRLVVAAAHMMMHARIIMRRGEYYSHGRRQRRGD